MTRRDQCWSTRWDEISGARVQCDLPAHHRGRHRWTAGVYERRELTWTT